MYTIISLQFNKEDVEYFPYFFNLLMAIFLLQILKQNILQAILDFSLHKSSAASICSYDANLSCFHK